MLTIQNRVSEEKLSEHQKMVEFSKAKSFPQHKTALSKRQAIDQLFQTSMLKDAEMNKNQC